MLVDKKHLLIFRKKKNDNLYIYNMERPWKGYSTKIILKKKEILRRHDEDDDYYEFIVDKIVKLSEEWKNLCDYLKKDKFYYCIKVKIFSPLNKSGIKRNLFTKDRLFIYCNDSYKAISLTKIRQNEKLYKKLLNRYCYQMNFGHPDSETFADYYTADMWFQWFYKKYPDYHLPDIIRTTHDIVVGMHKNYDKEEEPKIDYDFFDLSW